MEAKAFIMLMLAAFAVSGVIAWLIIYFFFREKKGKTKKIPSQDFVLKYKELAKKEFELLETMKIFKGEDQMKADIGAILGDKFEIDKNIDGVNNVLKKMDKVIGDQNKKIHERDVEEKVSTSSGILEKQGERDYSEKIKEVEESINQEKIGTDIDSRFVNHLIKISKEKNNEGKYEMASAYLSAAKGLFKYEKEKSESKSGEETNASDVKKLLDDVERLINKEKSELFMDTFFPEFILKNAKESYDKKDYKVAEKLAELSKEMLTDKKSVYKLRRLSEIIDSDVGLP